jgi:hypothetical protein
LRRLDNDAPNHLAYWAMVNGQLGCKQEAQTAAAKGANPEWSVESFVSSIGGLAREAEADVIIESSRKAGLPACMTAEQLTKQPTIGQLNPCKRERGTKS